MNWTVACQAMLVLTFAVAAAGKVRPAGFGEFRGSLSRSLPVPRPLGTPLAAGVVGAELTATAAMVLPTTARWGFGLAAILLAGFTGAILVMRRRGSAEPCRCFGASAEPPGRAAVVRNVLLLATAIFGLAGSPAGPGLPLPAVALAVAAGAVTALLLINLDEIAGLLAAT
ncbi:MauE/DoxX family redox-associated membrane protein [Actinoplanes derwentensis]|uniref:Methylamine utilisation protein MauE n=1 Tax=Actinoplanes derwentensis TaxID=113562 RepID=A0A1H1VT15_9ACTN|nr:MauE/DoxX family redox-associated membrane protein [Actinoplanes derwentensis]GID83587.1 methylamine utilization protein MauE [Actinoplanes derwentensis]SDS88108.1 Methylamine utilisation protein MauE [Actinoplanes derwentensis]